MLEKPIYAGIAEWKGRVYQGIHEPIISQELFDNVQNIRAARNKNHARQQQHKWAWQGMLTCGHCGCLLTAEIKKQKYIYYHCSTGSGKNKCPGKKPVREEEIANQFGEALRIIALDGLDRKVDNDFYEQKNQEWRSEQSNILKKIEQHQRANAAYLEEGIALLELSKHAVSLYFQQTMAEKRRIADFVYSNSMWKDGTLFPNYRSLFDVLSSTNIAYQHKKAASMSESGLRQEWLPVVGVFRTFFMSISEEIVDTIAAILGFMAA